MKIIQFSARESLTLSPIRFNLTKPISGILVTSKIHYRQARPGIIIVYTEKGKNGGKFVEKNISHAFYGKVTFSALLLVEAPFLRMPNVDGRVNAFAEK